MSSASVYTLLICQYSSPSSSPASSLVVSLLVDESLLVYWLVVAAVDSLVASFVAVLSAAGIDPNCKRGALFGGTTIGLASSAIGTITRRFSFITYSIVHLHLTNLHVGACVLSSAHRRQRHGRLDINTSNSRGLLLSTGHSGMFAAVRMDFTSWSWWEP